MIAIESDAESNSGLMIDEPTEGTPKQSVEQAMQSASADLSATPLVTGVQAPMEVGEEGIETAEALEFSAATPESESAMVVSSSTPTPISI